MFEEERKADREFNARAQEEKLAAIKSRLLESRRNRQSQEWDRLTYNSKRRKT